MPSMSMPDVSTVSRPRPADAVIALGTGSPAIEQVANGGTVADREVRDG